MLMQLINNVTSSFNYTPISGDMAIPIVFILVLALIVMTAIYIVSSLKRYQQLWSTLKGIADVLVTSVIGAITLGVAYVGYILFSAGASTVKDVDPMLYIYAAGGFTLSVIVGYGVKMFIKRISHYHEITTKPLEKKIEVTT